jgi:hypothetical protein
MQRTRIWFIGLGAIVAFTIVSIAQIPNITGDFASVSVLETPARAQSPSPSPDASPSPQDTETPASPSPSPQASPSPSPSPTLVEPAESNLTLGQEVYKDPVNRFQIGLIDGYSVGPVEGVPLIESPDGNLAYTVVVRQRAADRPLSPNALAQITIEAFDRGEGFEAGAVQPVTPGEIILPWTGQLTIGRDVQPIAGKILTRKAGTYVLMLLVSATEEAQSQVDTVVDLLGNSLQPI